MSGAVDSLKFAGWMGRDADAIEEHIAELEDPVLNRRNRHGYDILSLSIED